MWPIGLVLVEYLALSLLIDARDLVHRVPALRGLALGGVGTFLVATCTATLLAGRGALWATLRDAVGPPSARPAWLAGHLAIACGFLAGSAWLAQPGPELGAGWLLLWALVGLALAASLVASTMAAATAARVTRQLAPSIGLGLAVGSVAWAAAYGAEHLWDTLRSATFHGVAGLLGLLFDDVSQDAATARLALGDFRVHVAPECSGIEGLGLATIFLAAYLWFARRSLRFPAAWAILPVGIGLVLASNVVRIAALLVVGVYVSEDLAVGGFHSKAGWVLFCGIALGLVAASQRWLRAEDAAAQRSAGDAGDAGPSATAAYLVPLLALIGTRLVVGLLTEHADVLYALAMLAALVALAVYRRVYVAELQRPDAVAALAGVVCGVGWVAWAVWTRDPTAEPAQPPALTGLVWAAWVLFRVLGSTLVVPVVEELAFRGYLLRRLVDRDFTQVAYTRRHVGALLLSSLAFGASHSLWVAGIGAGVLFGLVVWRRGRLADAVLAHVVANAVVAAYVLIWDDWHLW